MQIPVLVIGGGPAGVGAALELARRGVGVRLIEQLAHAAPGSRAKGLQPRTLEMLEALGVQDSHNLGWKLAAVLSGAPEQLLDSCEEERRPIAARLMAGLNTTDEHGQTPDVFQLRNHYRERSLSAEPRRVVGAVQTGDRAPDAPLQLAGGAPPRLFELMRDTEFTCIAFGDAAAAACVTVVRHGDRATRQSRVNCAG